MNKSIHIKMLEVWFATGSQHLYGPETLKQVAQHSAIVSKHLNNEEEIPVKGDLQSMLRCQSQ